jgi:hypothetical protein
MNLDTLACAYIVHLLVRFTLYAYTIDTVLFTWKKYSGETLSDRGDMRQKFWSFAYYRRVDIPDTPTGFANLSDYRFKKFRRIGTAPLFVGIGKGRADIAESCRAEKRIDYRMNENIRVGMAL